FYKDGPLEAMPILQQTISPEMGNTAENPVMAKDALTTSNDIPMPGEINKRQKRSLVNRLREWLLTPASVKWKDINKFE
ncbi:MAG: hypothetical protein OEY43_09505, partial [Gammaproteobacteria bacterium]|nr:hypothetical protein [Gammaproteobacteria bacterium]